MTRVLSSRLFSCESKLVCVYHLDWSDYLSPFLNLDFEIVKQLCGALKLLFALLSVCVCSGGKYVPRAILVDLEPGTMDSAHQQD